jgi:very-short-patch-repair endonuclease
MDLRPVTAITRTHLGLITRAQYLALGLPTGSWQRLHASGALERVHRNVSRIGGTPETREQRILAALLAIGPGAMASHRTAAFIWGAERPSSDPIDVIVPRGRRPRVPGVVTHRPTDEADLRPVQRGPFAVTPPVRMLLDLGAVDRSSVASALDHVLRTRLMTLDGVQAGLIRHARSGRAGTRPLRAAVVRRTVDRRPVDSELEVLMAAVRDRYSLPAMTFHAVVAGYEVDFLIEGTRVIVECDGWSSHGLDRDQFEFDRVRDAELLAAGYVVVHVTWRQLTHAPSPFARRLQAVLSNVSGRFTTDGVEK